MPVTAYSSKHGKPHKSKRELAERIDARLREMRLHAGPEEFDPVEMMGIIGAEAYDEGDKHLALVAFKEMAQYVRPKLANVHVEAEVETTVVDGIAKSVQMAKQLGLPTEKLVLQFAAREGIDLEEAARLLEVEVPMDVAIPSLPPPDDD